MPRWWKLCKEGEKPSRFLDITETGNLLNIKNGFGPVVEDKDGIQHLAWNRCWSEIPEEWGPALVRLVDKIRSKYKVETIDDNEDDPTIQVRIDQVKDKFGSLRFYFTTIGDNWREMDEEIDTWVAECEEELKQDDPYYNVPY